MGKTRKKNLKKEKILFVFCNKIYLQFPKHPVTICPEFGPLGRGAMLSNIPYIGDTTPTSQDPT